MLLTNTIRKDSVYSNVYSYAYDVIISVFVRMCILE